MKDFLFVIEPTDLEMDNEGNNTLEEIGDTTLGKSSIIKTSLKKFKQQSSLVRNHNLKIQKNIIRKLNTNITDKNVETLMKIANSLDRMATSFEIIAESFGTKKLVNNQVNNEDQSIVNIRKDIKQLLELTNKNNQTKPTNIEMENNDKNYLLTSLKLIPKTSGKIKKQLIRSNTS